jgi:hypothetical protein
MKRRRTEEQRKSGKQNLIPTTHIEPTVEWMAIKRLLGHANSLLSAPKALAFLATFPPNTEAFSGHTAAPSPGKSNLIVFMDYRVMADPTSYVHMKQFAA